MSTTKQDLIASVATHTGLTQADTRIVVECLLDAIATELETGNSIEVRGFGSFITKIRKPRPARNPKTGEKVMLPTRAVALFKFSDDLKKRIGNSLKNRTPIAKTL